MGGIADYSGATVLEATIGNLAVVAVQRRADGQLRVRTTGQQVERLVMPEVAITLSDFYDGASLKSYENVQSLFRSERRWAAYLLGAFFVLLAEGEMNCFPTGADVLLRSTVPLGAGVASSAAIEVAAMRAIVDAYGAPVSGMRLASLCQLVENRVAGAPCGIMDQVTCTLGKQGALLELRCQPHDVLGWHAPPPGYTFIGLDSGVKHAVGGVRYPRVRCAAFMGKRIIQETLRLQGGDPDRARYLANLSPLELSAGLGQLLPLRLKGSTFLDRWGNTDDPATTVSPDEMYPVRGATEHPIQENARVNQFGQLLGRAAAHDAGSAARAMRAAGRLMYGSHRSYTRKCGLGSTETDLLVSLVRSAGPEQGFFGAKITGGGSGGTVAVLIQIDADGVPTERTQTALDCVSKHFAAAVGHPPRIISGSLPGAAELEPLTVAW